MAKQFPRIEPLQRDFILRQLIFFTAKGRVGVETYQREKNTHSIDGLPTGLFDAVDSPER